MAKGPHTKGRNPPTAPQSANINCLEKLNGPVKQRAGANTGYTCWCSIGDDLPGFGNEPGDSLEGNQIGGAWSWGPFHFSFPACGTDRKYIPNAHLQVVPLQALLRQGLGVRGSTDIDSRITQGPSEQCPKPSCYWPSCAKDPEIQGSTAGATTKNWTNKGKPKGQRLGFGQVSWF